MTTEELIGYLQNTIGHARGVLAVAALAIKGTQIELKGDVDPMRLFVVVELIEKTQAELGAVSAEIMKRKAT